MPDDAHLSTHAKVCALEVATYLQAQCGLRPLDPVHLYAMAGLIDRAITDAGNLQRIVRDADLDRQPP